jgi:hypothetical protein
MKFGLESVPSTAVACSDPTSPALKDVLRQVVAALLTLVTTFHESPVAMGTFMSLLQHLCCRVDSRDPFRVVLSKPWCISPNDDIGPGVQARLVPLIARALFPSLAAYVAELGSADTSVWISFDQQTRAVCVNLRHVIATSIQFNHPATRVATPPPL